MDPSTTRRSVIFTSSLLAARPFAQNIPTSDVASSQKLFETWDLSDLYKTSSAWDADHAALIPLISRLASFRDHLKDGASALAAALQVQSDAQRKLARMTTYAQARANEDLSIAANQSRVNVAQQLAGDLARAGAFIAPEVVALGCRKLIVYMAEQPRLYQFHLLIDDILRLSDHTLGEQAEGVIAATSTPFAGPLAIFNQLNPVDIPRPQVTLHDGSKIRLDEQGYGAAIDSRDQSDRKLVF